MNQATCLGATFLFEEDTCSVALAEEEAFGSTPESVNISVLELMPSNPQPLGDTLCLCQAQANPMPDAAQTAAEARDQGGPLLIHPLITL
jgi:hypothetical protein